MKAAVYEGKGHVNVREVPKPALEDGEVLLAIEACSICGTDLRTYRHGDHKITPRGSSATSSARASPSRAPRART